jgi:hypothetical protein
VQGRRATHRGDARDSAAQQLSADGVPDDVAGDVGIHGGEYIIKKHYRDRRLRSCTASGCE